MKSSRILIMFGKGTVMVFLFLDKGTHVNRHECVFININVHVDLNVNFNRYHNLKMIIRISMTFSIVNYNNNSRCLVRDIYLYVSLWIESRVLYVLSKRFTVELHLQPLIL